MAISSRDISFVYLGNNNLNIEIVIMQNAVKQNFGFRIAKYFSSSKQIFVFISY